MRQLSTYNKLIICIMFLFLLSACSSSEVTIKETDIELSSKNTSRDEESDLVDCYTISFADTSKMMDLPWSNELSFDIIQVQDMSVERLNLENTINKNIKKNMTSWIDGKVLNVDSVDLKITCHSARYLSFVNSFMYVSNRVDYINDYITIDMLTGQRVYLEDLVTINEKFVKHIQENADKVKDPPHPLWQGSPDLNEYSPSELLEELNKCSYTQEQLSQNGYYSIDESIGSLLFRNSFFVREGILVIILEQGGESFITLDIKDIEDFLKVDKW